MPRSSCWQARRRRCSARAPEYGAAFAEKLHVFDRPLQSLHELQTALGIDTSDKTFDFNPASLITGFLTIVTPAALQFVLQVLMFFATLFFVIMGRSGFRKYAVNWFGTREVALARAENPQRHRGEPRRLSDRRHRDQSCARRRHRDRRGV